jgi:vancomycin permeability regulator SanA
MREFGARVLVIYDMVTGRQPHFLGEKVEIPAGSESFMLPSDAKP